MTEWRWPKVMVEYDRNRHTSFVWTWPKTDNDENDWVWPKIKNIKFRSSSSSECLSLSVFGHVHRFWSYSLGHLHLVKLTTLIIINNNTLFREIFIQRCIDYRDFPALFHPPTPTPHSEIDKFSINKISTHVITYHHWLLVRQQNLLNLTQKQPKTQKKLKFEETIPKKLFRCSKI